MDMTQPIFNKAKQTAILVSVLVSIILSCFILMGLSYQINIFFIISPFIITPAVYLYIMRKYYRRKKVLKQPFPLLWKDILNQYVPYYKALNETQKKQFQREIQIFLAEKKITGVGTEIDEKCKVLVASSAIIPIFKFPEWEYTKLSEILVYPHSFDDNFDFNSKEASIAGMVGMGHLMILAKDLLIKGFNNRTDKFNVGIHEFIHKIDEADGSIDGVPSSLMNNNIKRQWIQIMDNEMEMMRQGRSDINPYGLTDQIEFFAVVSEYFFDNPKIMMMKHPELYNILCKIFKQNTYNMYKSILYSFIKPYGKSIRRNDPCPCGSGKKYKDCCLAKSSLL